MHLRAAEQDLPGKGGVLVSAADLSRFRADDPTPVTKEIRPLVPRFQHRFLAVDQSLTAAGWALIQPTGAVAETGTIKIPSEVTGHEGTLLRGSEQFLEFHRILRLYMPAMVVHETPPISRPGMKMMRPEASLVSANSLRCAAILLGIPVKMVGSQKAKTRWTGKRDASKKEVRQALLAIDPTLAERKPFNEHIVDAIALGWVALESE